MVDTADRIRVSHMIDAAEELLLFVKGKQRKDLDGDRLLTLAVLKELELIGEAASHVSSRLQAASPAIPWQLVIGMRHRLVHGYFDINLDLVWTTIERDIPRLLRELRRLRLA